MSYLGSCRLHFAGAFQATISTVNNSPDHFDNAHFNPAYQDQGFNPRGDGSWRLVGCKVTDAWLGPGTRAGDNDPVRSALIAGSDRKVEAKLVDLDPYQQGVSMIFGLEVRITEPDGRTLVRGCFDPAPYTDIWSRTQGGQGDGAASASYQSVLTGVRWDQGDSKFLQSLRAATGDGLLSIKFNVDGFGMHPSSPGFLHGRIVGTIGPATVTEPRQLVLGRHFMAEGLPSPDSFMPAGQINFCTGRVDTQAKRLYLDLGNALPTTAAGTMARLGVISVSCTDPTSPEPLVVGQIAEDAYGDPDWYAATAGIVEMPADRCLTPGEVTTIEDNPLVIGSGSSASTPSATISEPPGGLYVRADRFVLRMDPEVDESVSLYATRFGRPYPGARVVIIYDPSQLEPGSGLPRGGVEFPGTLTTDMCGVVGLKVRSHAPGNPRTYIDGQVYGIRPVLEETIVPATGPYPFNPSDFVSILVWDTFKPRENPPTWHGTLQPILQQYENLYPVMERFVKLGDYESVCANARWLLMTLTLDIGDPNYMPATRDLSTAKRAAIVRWLNHDGAPAPLLGTPPPTPEIPGAAEDEPSAGASPALGGKTEAARRRHRTGSSIPPSGAAD